MVSYRPLEGEERDQLGAPPPTMTDEWGCALSILGLATVLGCALGAAFQAVFQTVAHLRFLPFVTTLLLAAVAWRVAGAIRRTQRETQGRVSQDRVEDAAEVVEVWDPVAVQQEGDTPAYLLDIGAGKLLVLAGPELRDVPVVRPGRPWLPRDERSTDSGSPLPFLNSHFVLHRGRRSGRIFRIDVLGGPIAVTGVVAAGTVHLDGRESSIEERSLDGATPAAPPRA